MRAAGPRYGERARRPYRTVPPSTAGPAPVHRQSPPITANHCQSPPITANHRRAPFVLLHMRFCCTAYPGNVSKTKDHASPRSRSLDGLVLCSWCVVPNTDLAGCPTRRLGPYTAGPPSLRPISRSDGRPGGRPARRVHTSSSLPCRAYPRVTDLPQPTKSITREIVDSGEITNNYPTS